MKILRISIHTLALLVSLFLIFNLKIVSPVKEILLFSLVVYILSIFLISIIRELILWSFPRTIGLLVVFGFLAYQFFLKKYFIFDESQIINFYIFASAIVAFYSLLYSILFSPINISYKKLDVKTYRPYYWSNNILSLILLTVLLLVIFYIEKGKYYYFGARFATVLLAFAPYFSKNFVRGMVQKLQSNEKFSDLGISIGQLGKLARIKNFVFLKDKIISSGVYQISESEFRSTVKVTAVLQLARMLAMDWNPKIAKLFVSDEYEKTDIKYHLVQKNENGICVIDDDACMYHLGNATFVKDKIPKDDRANVFLLKNDIPIAKFRVNEKIMQERVEFLNQLDYFGKTILFNPGILEDLGHDYSILFDKIYSKVNENKQMELLKELEKEAPTALFISKALKEIPVSVCFYITSNIDVKNEQNKIVLDSQTLMKVPQMIQLAKKVHTLLKYSLISSIVFQLILVLIAFTMYKALLLILALNLAFGILNEIIPGLINKITNHFPSQPANLAQSHHAA